MKLDKSYKVRVTPEHSKKIHDLLNLGCPVVTNYLTVNMNGFVNITNSQYLFEKSEFTEIQADDLIALLTDLSKSATEIDTSANSVDILADNKSSLVDSDDNCQAPRVEPKFKVGDKVYIGLNPAIHTVFGVNSLGLLLKGGEILHKFESSCHATPENHALLSQLYPHIDFEAPPKELTGSDLCRAMLDKGWKYVPCYVSEDSDINAIDHGYSELIVYQDKSGTRYFRNEHNGQGWDYAVPFDPKTGEPLTQAVLDE